MADPQVQPTQGIQVVVEDDTGNVTVDPVSGTIATPQEGGGVVVQLDAHRPQAKGEPEAFDCNLVDDLAAGELSKIAEDLYEQIQADDDSRKQTLAIRARAMDFLGLELKEPRAAAGDTSAAIEGQSQVTNPLLLEACLKGWANAEAELLPSEGPVKIDEENSATTAEDQVAEAFERDVNYFFTDVMTEYYPDTSHMLLWSVYFGGSGIKKIYRCPLLRRPTSQSIAVEDFIVSDTTKDLKSCARITHQIKMRPSVMQRMILAGAYRDHLPPQPTEQAPGPVEAKVAGIQGTNPARRERPENQPYTIWETQCELDLRSNPKKYAERNIPLPYLVTMDKESREILALRRDWKEDDDDCKRKRMYVKFPYIPGPGFYGTGLLNILGNCSQAMTAAWRLALDCAMFANFPAGLIAKLGGRQNTSDIRLGPGTWSPIETNGQPIGNIIAPNPYRDITPGMLSLIQQITAQAKDVGGTGDLPTSEGLQNVPVGTMLAQIEQATKVIAAAHRGQYKAQAEEIGMIIDLLRESPEDFMSGNKLAKVYGTVERFQQALNDYNLIPRADPNTPSHIHRVAKALGLSQLFQIPSFAQVLDPREALQRILGIIRVDPTNLIMPAQPQGPPPPDPQAIAAAAKVTQANTAQTKAQTDAQLGAGKLQIDQQKVATEAEIAKTDLAKELVIHQADAAHDNKQLGLQTSQSVHDQNLDLAQHALDVHQVLNPPTPTDSGNSSP
jgi:tetratricopeptide (TPR) repeat protein